MVLGFDLNQVNSGFLFALHRYCYLCANGNKGRKRFFGHFVECQRENKDQEQNANKFWGPNNLSGSRSTLKICTRCKFSDINGLSQARAGLDQYENKADRSGRHSVEFIGP